MDSLQKKRELAEQLFREKRFSEMQELLSELIDSERGRLIDQALRSYRAYILECGGFGFVDLDSAYDDYAKLYEVTASGWVLHHMARVAMTMSTDNASLAAELYEESISLGDEIAKAHMHLGRLNQEFLGQADRAEQHFMKAFLHGEPWGLRYYARSKIQRGQLLKGAINHVLCTLVSPILFVLRLGRAPFSYDW